MAAYKVWDERQFAEIKRKLERDAVFRAVGYRLKEGLIAGEVMSLAGLLDEDFTSITAQRLHELYVKLCQALIPEVWGK